MQFAVWLFFGGVIKLKKRFLFVFRSKRTKRKGEKRGAGGAVDFQNEIAYNKLEVLWTIIDYGRLRYGYKKATATIR